MPLDVDLPTERVKYCKQFLEKGWCPFGDSCKFAHIHSLRELREECVVRKTVRVDTQTDSDGRTNAAGHARMGEREPRQSAEGDRRDLL